MCYIEKQQKATMEGSEKIFLRKNFISVHCYFKQKIVPK